MNSRIYTFEDMPAAITAIKEEYEAGYTYFHGKFAHNMQDFKVRMNKDHDMKDVNNCTTEHVLSIVFRDPSKPYQQVSACFFRNYDGFYRIQEVQHYRSEPDESGQRTIGQYEWEELERILTDFLQIIFEQEKVVEV